MPDCAAANSQRFDCFFSLFLSHSLSPSLLSSVFSSFRVSRNHSRYLHFFFARSHATLITNFASLTVVEYATEIDSQTSTGKIPLPYKEIYRESAVEINPRSTPSCLRFHLERLNRSRQMMKTCCTGWQKYLNMHVTKDVCSS